MTKKVTVFALLVMIMSFIVAPSQAAAQEKSPGNVQLVLHKLLFDEEKMPGEVSNDGNEGTLLTDYEGLNGAKFDVYDVTESFYEQRSKGKTVEEAQNILAEKGASGQTIVASQVTATKGKEDGVAVFNLPAKDSKQRDKVYLLIESEVPASVKERSKNLVVVLPIVAKNGETLSTIHLYPKNETSYVEPPFEKNVLDQPSSVAVGERITYQLETKLPDNFVSYEKFVIQDTTNEQLIFDEDSLKISAGDVELTSGFRLESKPSGFVLSFNLKDLKQYAGKTLKLTYQMILSPSAVPDEPIKNKAILDVGHDPIISTGTVRTGGKRFVKVDSSNQNKTLANAVFAVKNERNEYLSMKNDSYVWEKNPSADLVKLVSDKNGQFEITGLKDGKYTLEELEEPTGYIKTQSPIPFTVEPASYQESGKLSAPLNVINKKKKSKPALPQTGETAGIGLGVVGAILLGSAWFIFKKRKEGVEK